MSVTVQQILSDAKLLASKLKEHDSTADGLVSQAQFVAKKIDAMKQVGVVVWCRLRCKKNFPVSC